MHQPYEGYAQTTTILYTDETTIMNNRIYRPEGTHAVPRHRVYGFREFAMMYYPHVRPEYASRRLRRIINEDPYLRADLEARGFRPGARTLLPHHVACLLQHLGTPDEFIV